MSEAHAELSPKFRLWARPGVYGHEIRKRFADLSEAQLGAAVTYRPHVEPSKTYTAEWIGPPHRKYYLWRDAVATDGEPSVPGWHFQYSMIDDGIELPGWDVWEPTLGEILRYPPEYGPRNLVWRDESSGDVVDIFALSDDP
jgi:hypothetical protein